jgi:hypothetical protein
VSLENNEISVKLSSSKLYGYWLFYPPDEIILLTFQTEFSDANGCLRSDLRKIQPVFTG